MMAIADIFDALTASDRPYKKAVPVEKALDILESEVKDRAMRPRPGRPLPRGALAARRHARRARE